MKTNRRNLMLASVSIVSFAASGIANGQTPVVSVTDLEDSLRDDARFEQLLFNVLTLRSILIVLLAQRIPDPAAYAQLSLADEFQKIVQLVRDSRERVLADLKVNPSPVEFPQEIERALDRTTAELVEGGIRPESQIASVLIGSLRTFMAITSKSGQPVESWYCGIFPFNRYCG